MTQEEKAKAYDEALEKARAYFENENYTEMADVFPELHESDDERIRKGLIEALKASKTVGELKFVLPEPTREECIAYLEKQKEQKPADDKAFEEWIDGWFKEHKEKAYPQITMDEKEFKNFCRGIRNMYQQKPNIELIQKSWYMEGYHDRDFNNEPRWVIKTGEGGPRYEENPKYGQMLEAEQKPVEYLDKDKVYAIMKKLVKLAAFSQLIPINSEEYKMIDEITCDIHKLLDYPIEQKPVEWSEDFDKEVENVHKRYPEVSFAKLTRIAYHFSKWANRRKDIEWSEEDEKHRQWILECLADGKRKVPEFAEQYQAAFDWLKSLRSRPKSSDNWRRYVWNVHMQFDYDALVQYEDNEKYEIVKAGNKPIRQVSGRYIFLKDIFPQSHWKPSEEQMKALQWAIVIMEIREASDYDINPLKELYEQLKKLM